jgi:putative selenium metabolism hydrolase
VYQLSDQDRRAMTDFLKDLIRTPSFSHQEGDVAQRIAEELRAVGLTNVRIDRVGNVVGRLGSGSGTPSLLYNGHMDTVGVGDSTAWQRDPFGGEIVDGVIYGRGACDMKGAIAAMVYGTKMLIDALTTLSGVLYVVGVAQEEPCEGLAMRVLVEEEAVRPDFVVLGEATNLQISRGQRGRMEIKVTAKGRASHGSAPHRGINAIYKAAHLIQRLEEMTADLPIHPEMGQATLAVTFIENTGGSRNVIPDSCCFYIDRRLVLGETEKSVVASIKNLVKESGIDATVELTEHVSTSWTGYECRTPEYYPAWLIEEGHPLVQATSSAVEKTLGFAPELRQWAFSTDGVYTKGTAGIPTLGFGPGDEQYAHTINDQIRLEDTFKAASVYAQLAEEILQ